MGTYFPFCWGERLWPSSKHTSPTHLPWSPQATYHREGNGVSILQMQSSTRIIWLQGCFFYQTFFMLVHRFVHIFFQYLHCSSLYGFLCFSTELCIFSDWPSVRAALGKIAVMNLILKSFLLTNFNVVCEVVENSRLGISFYSLVKMHIYKQKHVKRSLNVRRSVMQDIFCDYE